MANKINIEIDLEDILYEQSKYDGNCYPIENLKESMQRQLKDGIVSEIKSQYLQGFKEQMQKELLQEIKEECMVEAKLLIPTLLKDILTKKYQKIDRYGSKSEETSFMDEFVKEIKSQMQYCRKSYDSDKNMFTRIIDGFTNELLKEFKSDFDDKMKTNILQNAYKYALGKISKAFNLSEKELMED